jgi:hypothetical protein
MNTNILGKVQGWALSLGLAVLALLIAVAGTDAQAGYASAVAVSPTLSTDIPKLWKKVQGKLMEGYSFLCPEWDDMDELQNYQVDMSTREITVPIDTDEDGGIASIPEGGFEAFPTSPAPRELTLAFIQTSGRFSVSGLTRYIEKANPGALITSQIAYQGKKKLQAVGGWWSDMFYGYSTGVRAQVSGNPSSGASHTLTLTNGYGSSLIATGTTAAQKYMARLFRKSRDRVALVRSDAFVASGAVTDRSLTNGTIDVTWDTGTPDPAASDNIVLANAMYDTAAALTQTDYNRGLVGLLDACLSTSVHGLSGSTVPEWNAALNDSAGGRFTGIRFRKAADEIENAGGGTLNTLYMAQGVYRDMLDNYQGALRFTDAFALEADGEVKIRGVQIKKSRRVPPGMVIGLDKSAYRRLPNVLAKPDAKAKWPEAEKFVDRDAWKFGLPFIGGNVVLNRGNFAIFSGLTEQ